jgi:hypothetical protein
MCKTVVVFRSMAAEILINGGTNDKEVTSRCYPLTHHSDKSRKAIEQVHKE